jgi:glycerol-3-phosphate cytidylyltransferase
MIKGITFGCFDLCHTGHILMLEECKSHCDTLTVGLHVDPKQERTYKNTPIQSLFERYVQLRAVKYVDEIIPYQFENEIESILKSYKFNVRFVGSDYINRDFTGRDYCIENGIEIFFNKRDHDYSSTELRKRIENSSNG